MLPPHRDGTQRVKYTGRVRGVDIRLARQQAEMADEIDLSEDDVYIERLGGGLYTLELLGIMFASVFATGHDGIRHRLLLQMELQAEDGGEDAGGVGGEGGGDGGGGIEAQLRTVRDVLETHAENIGEADGEAEQMRRKTLVVKLLVAVGGGRSSGGDRNDSKKEEVLRVGPGDGEGKGDVERETGERAAAAATAADTPEARSGEGEMEIDLNEEHPRHPHPR